jgi:ubiquinone/menaquinone biosynthesis C-methylase UbiE
MPLQRVDDLTEVREYFRDNVAEWERDRYTDETYLGRSRLALSWLGELPAGSRVLDLGCGGGHQSYGAQQLGMNVVSSDFAPEMACTTRDRRGPGAAAVVADARRTPFRNGSFDAVMLLGVLGYLPDPQSMLTHLSSLVRRGGRLIIDVANPEPYVLLHNFSRAVSAPLNAFRRTPNGNGKDFYARTFVKYRPEQFEEMLAAAGFRTVARGGAGFGDIRVAGRGVLPWRVEKAITRGLNALSRRPAATGLARRALIYVVHAVKE